MARVILTHSATAVALCLSFVIPTAWSAAHILVCVVCADAAGAAWADWRETR